ncbi:hypothetical protein HanXRQr2_Chr05g0204321 [Helianthus annuus]|uniref:Uncharacterized protein n=1 Tax=Helianthus annuus TaxID=4232 RepID=A0A9K3NLR9_HELAN|nr:hypothetical protein HanXRQr2_Chr05g0204321 [Helianthus annuus]KAJ0921892.1 hypothetical protein HanPSC8_Chr05g0197051 [Helianthus annuus]
MAANIAAASTVNNPISTAKPPIFTPPGYGKSQPSFGSLQRESPNTTIANWIAQPRYRLVTQTPILLKNKKRKYKKEEELREAQMC